MTPVTPVIPVTLLVVVVIISIISILRVLHCFNSQLKNVKDFMFEYCTVVRFLSRKGQAVPLFRAYIGGTSFVLLSFGFPELKITFGTSSSCYSCRTRSPQRLVIPFSVQELQQVLFPPLFFHFTSAVRCHCYKPVMLHVKYEK